MRAATVVLAVAVAFGGMADAVAEPNRAAAAALDRAAAALAAGPEPAVPARGRPGSAAIVVEPLATGEAMQGASRLRPGAVGAVGVAATAGAAAPELTSLPVTAFFFIGEWAGPLVMGALGLAVAAVTGAAAY
ncbi:MAG: hypothetical protein AB7P02_31310, partial [Alphaproteobacteria bacterium]